MEKQIYQQMTEFFSRKDSKEKYELGLGQIDGMINGIEKGKLLVVAGQANDGREAVMYTFIKHLAVDLHIPSLVINLVTSEDTFYYELMSNVTDTDIDDIREEDVISKGSILKDSEIYVEFPKDRSLEHIEQTIRDYAQKGVELVFIDMFQAVDYKDDIEHFCDNELLFFKEKNSKHLYLLSKDLRINIFMGSAVSYMASDREGLDSQKPILKDMVYASRLDEYSDVVLGVFVPYTHSIYYDFRGKNLRDQIEVTVLKNKINHKLGCFSMKYDFYHNKVVDDKGYNKELVKELMNTNTAFNELVIGMGLMPANE